MTEGESRALVQSLIECLIHTACGYEAWRQLNIQYYGRYTNLRLRLSPTWGHYNSATLNGLRRFKIKGQLRNHLPLNMDKTTSFEDVKKRIGQRMSLHGHQSSQPMEIDQINGFKGKKGKSKGPPIKGMPKGKGIKGKNLQHEVQRWGQNHQNQYQGSYQQQNPMQSKGKQGKGKSSSQRQGLGKRKVSDHLLDLWQTRPHQCWWQGPSQEHSRRTKPIVSQHRAVVKSQDSGIQGPSSQTSLTRWCHHDINQRIRDDSCCEISNQSDVNRCGQKSLMYDGCSCLRGQKLQSVIDGDIKVHGFKQCNIICDVS
eukprot:1649772-Amphidinium_carterae.3